MSMFFFTYRAQTQARRGASILRDAGIAGKLDRAPSRLAINGCGYGLWVPGNLAYTAAMELRGRNCMYERSYQVDGNRVQEVSM